jgi:hypothetical protein
MGSKGLNRIAAVWLALAALSGIGCRSEGRSPQNQERSHVQSAAECEQQCAKLGAPSAQCARICAATCAQRCEDMRLRIGNDLVPCPQFCGLTCSEFNRKFGYSGPMCEWIVENRIDPNVTPLELKAP